MLESTKYTLHCIKIAKTDKIVYGFNGSMTHSQAFTFQTPGTCTRHRKHGEHDRNLAPSCSSCPASSLGAAGGKLAHSHCLRAPPCCVATSTRSPLC